MTIAGVLLAAGAGSRFEGQQHKLTASLDGEPVVAHALRAMVAAGFNQTFVVTGAVELDQVITTIANETGSTIELIANPRWSEGQATSIRAAIDVLEPLAHTAVVIGLGDQPLVGTAAWRVVGASHGELVTASFAGAFRPPVKIGRSLWSQLPESGDEGARVLIREHPDLVSAVPCPGDPSDIDTVDDLGRLRGRSNG